jgi:uncharacterized membrane protein
MKFELSIEIDQPPSVVYDFMMDPENLHLWLTNFVRMEHLSGEPGEPGAKAKHVYDERGRHVEMVETIISNVENQEMIADYESEYFDMRVSNYLEPKDDHKTLLSIVTEMEMKSFVMKLVGRLFKGQSEKRLAADMERLKDAIEELTEIEGD